MYRYRASSQKDAFMKNISTYSCIILAFLFLTFSAGAQDSLLVTVAGNGLSGFSGDGGPATNAKIGQALGACVDNFGNIYIADYDNRRIRKVDPSGIITTIAGGGSSTADGVPATSASLVLNASGTMTLDPAGNLVFMDGGRIRKLDFSTSTITTIAGLISSGYSGDGAPATAAQFNSPGGLCYDASGNLLIGDQFNNRVRKINTSGIITTIAGTGTTGAIGDGGPATDASLHYPCGICIDPIGNIYVADVYHNLIRKISPTGIISTVAGGGHGGDGGPATDASFNEPSNVCLDYYGNLYIADFHSSRIRKVTPTGIISTFAGGGLSLASGVPATAASFSDTWGVSIDNADNIYISDRHHNRICRVNGMGVPTVATDSFVVSIANTCAGMRFRIISNTWHSGLNVKSYLGNGQVSDTFLIASGVHGVAELNSDYGTGNYTIKHVLYDGSSPIDSITYNRIFATCQNIDIAFYYDANGNCMRDTGEYSTHSPIMVTVDSVGISIDTLTATSGLHYRAYGTPGSVYTFRALPTTSGLSLCGSGVITDTIPIAGTNAPKQVGLSCGTSGRFDLRVFPSFRAGVHLFGGTIMVDNTYCVPQSATVSMEMSPTYNTNLHFTPTPTSLVGNTVTWDAGTLSSLNGSPLLIRADMEKAASATPAYGDIVETNYSISPISGDENPGDNTNIRIDTVKSGYDPNDIAVSPKGCLLPDQRTLQYTIRFENTGNDTAFNIFVLDTLPPMLNPKSMKILAASAEMYTSVLKWAGRSIVKFDFPYINLLDSSHHGYCNGMVVFTIDVKDGFPAGTTIPNSAGIYFDYNPVVLTNTETNIIGCETSAVGLLDKKQVNIFPNPTRGELTIQSDDMLLNSLNISNCMGQVVVHELVTSPETRIDISQLPTGVYTIALQGNDIRIVRKLVKM